MNLKALVCGMFFISLLPLPLLAATTSAVSKRDNIDVVVPNHIAGGKKVVDPPAWAAIVVANSGFFNEHECSASFLSPKFVITSEHCVRNIPPNAIAVTVPGKYRYSNAINESRYDVQAHYRLYGADIALLALKNSNTSVENFPLFHNRKSNPGDIAVIYGASDLSSDDMGTQNDWHHLYRSSVKLVRMTFLDTGFINPMYYTHWNRNPPAGFPPGGHSQPGDSGGAVLGALWEPDDTAQRSSALKAIGLIHSGPREVDGDPDPETFAAPLNDDALDWLGNYVGIIRSPGDKQHFNEHVDDIEVEVSTGTLQPVSSVALFNESGGPVGRPCSDFHQKPNNHLSCSLPRPTNDGLYMVRAFRDDRSYDEVTIVYQSAPSAAGDGLTVLSADARSP